MNTLLISHNLILNAPVCTSFSIEILKSCIFTIALWLSSNLRHFFKESAIIEKELPPTRANFYAAAGVSNPGNYSRCTAQPSPSLWSNRVGPHADAP